MTSIVQFTCSVTVRFTKGGSVLPLYKISVLLKTGGAGRFYNHTEEKKHLNDSIDSVVVKSEDFVVGNGGSNPSMALFCWSFSYTSWSFHLIFSLHFVLISCSKIFQNASKSN